ncbi:hypothetical protein M0657_005398 [Pyricularia oryzae]|uniref:Uncharacterized protein n=1 Tax=Pyricularia oryzae TaxID=318829 RepID=A0A4P7NT41_PYROR|nr:hypothetical protein M9X92_007744 [Pyricularia oryzae]KAI7922779.1 hypothetical protein M0657_005398 [Pyricularia oryzae]QBZ65611.1 hypothetical protein PoMZ_12573 [Pyricularia oryzae]
MAVSFRESGDAEKHQPIQIRVRERVQTFEYATETKRKTTSCNNARGNNARAKRPPELVCLSSQKKKRSAGSRFLFCGLWRRLHRVEPRASFGRISLGTFC